MISISEAIQIINSQALSLKTENVSIDEVTNRALAENVYSDRDYPPFNRSTMDGFAINSKNFLKGKEWLISKTIPAGTLGDIVVADSDCVRIMTGARVPENLDVVIKIEDSVVLDDKVSFKTNSVIPFLNIAKKGEDLKENTIVLESGTLLNPLNISLLASVGKNSVRVFQSPKVAILSTGNEIVPLSKIPKPEEIRDSNSYTLVEFLKRYKINPVIRKIVPDEINQLSEEIENALSCDIIFITGGVSMGDFDFIPKILMEKKINCLFHKVEIRPGKPLWFGVHPNGNIVFALPGNPFAVQVAFKIFIEPFIRKILQMKDLYFLNFPFIGQKKKRHNLTEFFPASIESKNGKTYVKPLQFNGSGDITAASRSEGLCVHPKEKETLCDTDIVEFIFW